MELERIQKKGGAFVIVPEMLFKQMAENAEALEDIRAFDAAMARAEEGFPLEFGERLGVAHHAGKSLIPLWREYRGMTQRDLGLRSGVKQPYLSDIESGKKPGSVKALSAIAAALAVSVEDLL